MYVRPEGCVLGLKGVCYALSVYVRPEGCMIGLKGVC